MLRFVKVLESLSLTGTTCMSTLCDVTLHARISSTSRYRRCGNCYEFAVKRVSHKNVLEMTLNKLNCYLSWTFIKFMQPWRV